MTAWTWIDNIFDYFVITSAQFKMSTLFSHQRAKAKGIFLRNTARYYD